MAILVSGSVAFDHIMVFPDRFVNHILPDKVHALNVSFNISSLKTHFGGVAANIAYHLRLLGAEPLILATVGSDFGSYAHWLDKHGIRRDGIRVYDDVRTPQGFVTTDVDDCQIWAFYEGAMARAHEARVEDVSDGLELAIVSSNGKRAMIEHARALKRRGVPTYIDPSHGLPLLSRDELVELIDGAAGYFANDYEWSLTLQQTGLGEAEIASRCGAIVITRGPDGSEIRANGEALRIPALKVPRVVDPTGCGDAYRAGFLYGVSCGHALDVAGRMGSLLGAYQVEVQGTQVLNVGYDEFGRRYAETFGAPF
ncbi:MAG: carbohydrate kinase family protein [Myxococcales bacterium]|nr:carbohydrate kinase family protein [Myxococcales bacterium]MDH5306220.1 carbohydrate kinase family protein [Myxococcales bacterium]